MPSRTGVADTMKESAVAIEAERALRQAEEDLERAYERLEAAFVAHQNAFGEYELEFGELPPIYVESGNPKTAKIDAALLACQQAEKERDDARRVSVQGWC